MEPKASEKKQQTRVKDCFAHFGFWTQMWNHPSRRYLTPRICGDLSEHMNLNCNIWDLKLKATLVNVYQAVVKNDCWHPAASCILSPIYCCVDPRVTAESRRSAMTALYVLEITILLCVKKYIELLYWLLYYFLFMKRNAMYYYKNKCNIISNLLILYWYFVFVQTDDIN